jgi:hypothetical protein
VLAVLAVLAELPLLDDSGAAAALSQGPKLDRVAVEPDDCDDVLSLLQATRTAASSSAASAADATRLTSSPAG